MEEQQLQTCLPLIICTNKIQKQKLPGGCNLHLILSFVTCTICVVIPSHPHHLMEKSHFEITFALRNGEQDCARMEEECERNVSM